MPEHDHVCNGRPNAIDAVALTKGWDPPRGPGWGRTAEDQRLQVHPCHDGITVSSQIPNGPSQPSLFLFNSVLKTFTLLLKSRGVLGDLVASRGLPCLPVASRCLPWLLASEPVLCS